jgi:hypothetical protein
MIRVTFSLFFGSVLLLQAQVTHLPPAQIPPGQAMTDAAFQLAARISSLLPKRAPISLEAQTLTQLSPAEWLSFRRLLQDELRKSGISTAETPPDPHVRVTLSEDARGLLFVAEVSSGDNRQIAMLPWNVPSSAQPKPRISLTKKPLWTEAEPILDILMVDSGSQMLVLSSDRLASYRSIENKWTASATASLVLPRPLPRDPRGRLEATADGFRAFLPAATCQGTLQPELRLKCVNGTETWRDTQEHWIADRNTLESDAVKFPFLASASGLFVMADGRVQDRSGQPVSGVEGWGSDIAATLDPCGSAVAIIASANADREELRVFEVANGQAAPASNPLPLPGPVTALWQSEALGEATLVVRNLQTGQYEASRLGVACTE